MQPNEVRSNASRRFFEMVVSHPRKILAACLLVVLAATGASPGLVKDTRSDAFIPPDDPSLVARERTREIFGLSDPILVAIVVPQDSDVFTPDTLALVDWLQSELEATPGIDGSQVTSLASESDIRGTEDGMSVEPFLDPLPATVEEARRVREAVLGFPLYVGSLVSGDARSTLVAAELDPEFDAGETYEAVVELARRAPTPDGVDLFVAGEGGVAGHLGAYIDADSRVMLPIVLASIMGMLFFAYATPRSVVLPNLVVIGACLFAVGAMAALHVPWFLITTALPVIVVAIGVADSIHVLGHYYRELELQPDADQCELVVRAMTELARPIAITSFTDMAGFLALAASTEMPPLRYFGLFASVGVAGTFLLSITALPAALSLLPKRASAYQRRGLLAFRLFWLGAAFQQGLGRLGTAIGRRPGPVLALALAVVGLGVFGIRHVEVDHEGVRNFRPETAIRRADAAINAHLDGTNFLDVVIESEAPQGLYEPAALRRIEAFQRFAETLPHVGGTTSIVDYLKQMNRSLHADEAGAHRLPETREAVAQTLLVYELEGDGEQIGRSVDFDYQRANVRIALDSGRYTDAAPVVEAVEGWLARELAGTGLEASLAGRVNVDYRWMRGVETMHFLSVAFALLAVFATSGLLLRSLVAGFLTLLPVCVAVGMLYFVMWALGIWLSTTTAMFAAIAIGLGVDFSVHLLERLRGLVQREGRRLDEAVAELFPTTGRELFFNFACAGLGFGVLLLSRVPTLVEFGVLTLVAVGTSFMAGLTMIPAIVCRVRPSFVVGEVGPVAPRPRFPVLEPVCARPPALPNAPIARRLPAPVIASRAWVGLPQTGRSSSSASSRTTPSPSSRRAAS